jgi:hypothetical protein
MIEQRNNKIVAAIRSVGGDVAAEEYLARTEAARARPWRHVTLVDAIRSASYVVMAVHHDEHAPDREVTADLLRVAAAIEDALSILGYEWDLLLGARNDRVISLTTGPKDVRAALSVMLGVLEGLGLRHAKESP